MLGEEFAEMYENYYLARIFSSTRNLDGLEFINSEIARLWENRPIVSDDEYECISMYEKSIQGNLCDNIESDLAGMWEYSLNGDSIGMVNAESDGLKFFYSLKSRGLLTNDIISFTRNRLEEMGWLCRSSAYNFFLKDFERTCFKDGDLDKLLSKIGVLSNENRIKGPRLGVS